MPSPARHLTAGVVLLILWHSVLGGLPSARSEPPPEPGKAAVDLHGDPLPEGAFARLGTVRLRQPFAWCVAFSPDGKVLASGGRDDKVILWDPATGKQVRSFAGHKEGVNGIAFSRDGKLLASAGQDGAIRLWDAATGRERDWTKHREPPLNSVAFSPDGTMLASGGQSNAVRVWDVKTGKEPRCFQEPPGHYIQVVCFSPDGKYLAAARTNKVDLWEVSTWKYAGSLEGYAEHVRGLAFSADSQVLFTGAGDTTVRFWDVAKRKQLRCLGKPPATRSDRGPMVNCLAVAPDGKKVAAGRQDGGISVWDAASGKELRQWEADQAPVKASAYAPILALAFAPDSKVLATVSRNGLRLWDAETGKRLDPFLEPPGRPGHLAFSPDGKHLAVADDRDTLRLIETRTRKERVSIPLRFMGLCGFAFSPDGQGLAFVENPDWPNSIGSRIRLLDVATGREKAAVVELPTLVSGFASSPRLNALVGLSMNSFIVWDPVTLKEQKRFHCPQWAFALASSPDGRLLACAEQKRVMTLWDPVAGTEIRSFGQQGGWMPVWAFSPDNRMVASPGCDKPPTPGDPREAPEVILWETATGKERCRLRGHNRQIFAIAFSPDGRLIATAAREETILLWDAATGKEVGRLTGHRGWVEALAFSPDGKVLVSGSIDTTILFWNPWSILPERKRPAGKLDREELSKLYTALASTDATAAYQAIGTLADHPDEAVPFIRRSLGKEKGPDPEVVARLIRDLDAEDFSAREKASTELAKLGRQAERAMRQALEGKFSPEGRRRLNRLLDDLRDEGDDVEKVRSLRVVEVLEKIGTPAAQEVLRDLKARGKAEVAEDAKASLERLARRSATKP
jgi:WD40 repeat protein